MENVCLRELEKMPESEVVALAQNNDRNAFNFLYRKHYKRVLASCVKMTRNAEDAENLVQETFLKAFRKLGSFRLESPFHTWLYSIARNEFLMSVRNKHVAEVSINNLTRQRLDENENGAEIQPRHGHGGLFEFEGDSDVGTEDRALEAIPVKILIREAVQELPPGYRAIIEEHHFEDLMLKECAAKHGFCEGNAKSQHHRALESLAEIIAGKYGMEIKLRNVHGSERKEVIARLAKMVGH